MKKIEEIKAIIGKYIQDTFTEEQLIESFNTVSINEILEKSLQYFSKFIKQLNFQVKYYDIKEDEEFKNFIIDVFLEFWTEGFASDTLQDRVFILKNYRGLGSISIEKQGVVASCVKKYNSISIDGDLCWGYKNGGSTTRTAKVLLNEVIYDYIDNEDYRKMASDFADEVLSIFQQNKPARIEERKIIDWVIKYKENNNISINENIVKKVCTELGITQKELAEIMKINDVTVRNWSSKGQIPDSSIVFMEYIIENKKLKDDLTIIKKAHEILHR